MHGMNGFLSVDQVKQDELGSQIIPFMSLWEWANLSSILFQEPCAVPIITLHGVEISLITLGICQHEPAQLFLFPESLAYFLF